MGSISKFGALLFIMSMMGLVVASMEVGEAIS